MATGQIFDIQRFSIHDGPGIRTTVFMKGCPLECIWCHNPEGIDRRDQLSFLPDKCIGCGWCFRACPNDAHEMVEGEHVVDRKKCVICGQCASNCHARALEIVGREVTAEECLAEVLRDKPFYDSSGGGMTISGGEPFMQATFIEELLLAAKSEGLHCAVETCGYARWEQIDRIRPLIDLFLFDVKETDPARHREYTGVDNDIILANLRKLHDAGSEILLRLPIVPTLNDRVEHFQAVAELAKSLPGLLGTEVIPYHRLGVSKRHRFGLSDEAGECLLDVETPEADTVQSWIDKLKEFGVTMASAG